MTIPDPILRGAQVRLTALTEEDLPDVARWQADAQFLRLLDARPAYPQEEETLRQWMEEKHEEGDGYLFAIRTIHLDDLIGYIELDGILWAHGVGWLSIAIGERENWGRGYGAEALQLALTFAFHELNLHRVQLTVFRYNERAIKLYEKLNFRHEGTFREFLERDGARHDMLLYGLLRREWTRASSEEGGNAS
jgi:RimJ/RimL family protein N-acetyltransferase